MAALDRRRHHVLDTHHLTPPLADKAAGGLQPICGTGTADAMTNDQRVVILAAIERTPDWVRRDLAAKDEASRQRAEESLAAIVASALEPQPAT